MYQARRTAGLMGLSALIALAAAAAVYLYSQGGVSEAATFSPTSDVYFCNNLLSDFPSSKPSTDADLAGTRTLPADPPCSEGTIPPGTADVDLTTEFTVAGGDSNVGTVVTNIPGTTVADAAITNGEKVGGLRSDITLGLLNGPCATALIAEFVLYDSATTGASVPALAEGTTNRFSNLVTDLNLDEIADSSSPFVGSNVDFYEELFTPANSAIITPKARYTGASVVPAAGDWQIVSLFQVDAGGLDAFATDVDDEPHPFGRVSHSPADGTLSVTVLNDPTALEISINPIHDFCAPLFTQGMLLGRTPAGQLRYTTPAAGTQGISTFSYGLRDADGDGLENSYDTCPFASNTGDSDFDGIDDACDTDLPVAISTDVDSDGFANRQDNCPQVANGSPQVDSEADDTLTTYKASAPDGGPLSDSIGDECDPNDFTAFNEGGVVQSYLMVPKCIGGGDGDGDGYCAAQDPDDAAIGVTGFTLNKGMDSEYTAANGHGDGGGGNWEFYWGTDPTLACGPGANPFDLIQNNTINIFDVLALKTPFGSAVTDNTTKKFDLVPNLVINIFDVLALKAPFGSSCTP
ncbi:MAG TPA: thrombospondin type 3 repeat-containing protein [Dehalococcoidia bacterium]